MDGVSAFLYHQEQFGTVMHTLKISILDISETPGGWNYAQFRKDTANRLHLLPMFRWKALKVPFSLHHPVWVDDPDFDLDYHLRRISCPAPGDRKAFCELISDLYSWPLDLTKPPWLCWVVEGLQNNEVALVTLVHHAYCDGSGAARLLHKVFSASKEAAEPITAPEWIPEKTPSRLALLGRALIDLPRTWYHIVPRTLKGIANERAMKKKYAESGQELPPSAAKDTRDSPFNIMLGRGRTFVYDTLVLEDVRAISKGFEVTINDLFVASAAGAFREFMRSRGYNPDTGPLITAVPISKRPSPELDDMFGNKGSTGYLAVPVHLSDPMARLKAATHSGSIMKAHMAAAEGMDFGTLLEILPPIVFNLLDRKVRATQGKFGIWGNVGLSNVPGPRQSLYMGNMRMNNWVSMGMVFHGMALNTTVWSYAGKFNLSVLADKSMLPDGWEIIALFRKAFDEYTALLKAPTREVTSREN
jgi:WS/DGAT/MGAT family acyltransferase